MNNEKELIMPKHIAMVLDGNRRWAKEKGMPTLKGHQKGFENIRDLTPYIFPQTGGPPPCTGGTVPRSGPGRPRCP